MRRHYLFLCFLLLAVTSTVVLVATTQARSVREGERAPETLAVPAGNMVSGLWQPLELTPTEAPVSPLAAPASELCTKPTTLKFPDGGQTTVNGALEVDTDPVLSCTNGTPPGPRGAQGYRTVWYQFTAPDSGYVLLEMEPNADYLQNYDTVLAVFEGPDPAFGETLEGVCPILETRELACNDDTNGFLSRVQVQVERGKSYLVEIADWQFGASGTRKLNVRSQFILPNYRWEQQELMALPRSRYAMTQVHDDLYLIGGQTIVSGNPVRTSSVQRYNLSDHTWTNLASLPGPDGLGYSNTGAAYLGNKIYVPSGYVGDDDLFDGAHWVYDISTDTWSDDLPSAPWPDGKAFAYVGAVGYAPFGIYYVIGVGDGGQRVDGVREPHRRRCHRPARRAAPGRDAHHRRCRRVAAGRLRHPVRRLAAHRPPEHVPRAPGRSRPRGRGGAGTVRGVTRGSSLHHRDGFL